MTLRWALIVGAVLYVPSADTFLASSLAPVASLLGNRHGYRCSAHRSVRMALGKDMGSLMDWERQRPDEDDDSVFYSLPRLVYHQDHESIGRLTNLYAELLPECGDIADIMSSWTSHLPEQAKYSRVVGIGMNRAELLSNPRLDEARVQDLNADPAIALPSAYADAVTIASGMQYLTRPEEVLADVRRVLRDTDSKLVLSWTDNFFPSKSRVGLVLRLLADAGFENATFHETAVRDPQWVGADELYVVSAARGRSPVATPEPASAASPALADPLQDVMQLPDAASRDMGQAGVGGGVRGITADPGSVLAWRTRLDELVAEAAGLGIPPEACEVGGLMDGPPLTVDEIRDKMAHIQLIIASRLSSNL